MASYFPCNLMRLLMLVSNVMTECSSTPFSSLEASFLLDSKASIALISEDYDISPSSNTNMWYFGAIITFFGHGLNKLDIKACMWCFSTINKGEASIIAQCLARGILTLCNYRDSAPGFPTLGNVWHFYCNQMSSYPPIPINRSREKWQKQGPSSWVAGRQLIQRELG